MARDNYNNTYSSHRYVFIERFEKNLEYYLKDQIKRIYKLKQEILCIIYKDDLYNVLKELKNNSEFNIQSLKDISRYRSGDKVYVLISLYSVVSNFSILIKISIPPQYFEKEYDEIVNLTAKFYHAAGFYRDRTDLKLKYSDATIFSQNLDGMDCFDIYLSTCEDKIENVYIDTGICKTVSDNFYHDLNIISMISYVSRFDYRAGIFPELSLCMCFEDLMQMKIPRRSQYTRMLLCELYRISNHIYFIVNISKVLGCDVIYNLALTEKERALRIIEFITGSRIVPNFIRIGGVRKNIDEENTNIVISNLPVLYKNTVKIEKMLLGNAVIAGKLKDLGVINKESALEFGLTGPNLRASGVRYDLRKNRNLLMYKNFSFIVPIGKYGDCLSRVLIRFQEIYQSISIIRQILGEMPEDSLKKIISMPSFEFPFSAMTSSIECPHGDFKIFIEVKGNKLLSLVIMGPSKNSLLLSEEVLRDNKLEDLNLILASLDISSGEIMHS